MKRCSEFSELLTKHRLLDQAIELNRNNFISDWNCDNPLLKNMIGPQLLDLISGRDSTGCYIYFDEEKSILESIQNLHLRREGLQLSRDNLVAGPGSSSFLAAFSLWLRQCGFSKVHYLPPIYHNFHFFLEMLDIEVTPLSAKHGFEVDYTIDFPSYKTVLLLCDPIWYAGKALPIEHVKKIADWQRATKSLVFVDGSFQYMKWDRGKSENTALFDPNLTFRLICPAKALAVPFFRFAYLLHPSSVHREFLFLYESIVGGSSASDLAFAHRALEILDSDIAYALTDLFKNIFFALTERNLISTEVVPECGYFVFAVPGISLPNNVVMDQSYFELKGYPNYCRINLMAARRIYSLELPGIE
jgi:aspartate/methionine/tyrosine aminotransferase